MNKDPAAEERFKEVNEAYHVLSDPETRRRYDRFGPDFRQIPEDWRAGRGPVPGPGGPAAAAGRPAPDGGPGFDDGAGLRQPATASSDVDLEDLLGGLFGGARAARARWPRRRPGGRADADRRGGLPGRPPLDHPAGPDGPRSYEVTIPAGVVDGQRIRLAGAGRPGHRRRPRPATCTWWSGIAPHPRYRLEGRDIHVDLPVTPWEAALGATVPVDTPGGEAKVKVPPGSSTRPAAASARPGHAQPARPAAATCTPRSRIMVPPQPEPTASGELFEELAKVSTFDPRRSR